MVDRRDKGYGVRSPQLLTPEVHDKIVRLVRIGNYFETASKSAGIEPMVGRNWIAVGARMLARGEDGPMARFSADVSEAMSEAETNAVALISKAGLKDWKALAWRLERMYPRKYGQRVRAEVANAIHAFLDACREEFPREDYLRLCRIAADFETGAVDEAVPEDPPGVDIEGADIH